MTMDELHAQMEAIQQSVGALGKSSHGTNQEVKGLSNSLLTYGKLIKGTIIADIAEKLTKWAYDQLGAQRNILKVAVERGKQLHNEYREQKEILDQLKKAHTQDQERLDVQTDIVKKIRDELDALRKGAAWRHEILKAVERHRNIYALSLGVLGFISDKIGETVAMSHQYNRALMQANTSIDQRYDLIGKTLAIQTQLGLSTASMAESAEALVEYGQEMTPAFQQNLKIISMMKEGLGVSARTGAQLVTIFTQQLHESAAKVGDVIATIAQETGLAAERAAEFAIEIARAVRLLGADFKSDAAGVTEFIGGLAGRIQEMGGNASSVVEMFKAMSGGTAQAFFLRGFAGVGAGQMGSAGGAEAAMRGLARRMGAIISAPEGTEAFLAQVQAVSEISGMAAVDIINFRKEMENLKKPMTEAQALQSAYNKQTALLGDAFKQLRESMHALIMQAMVYIMPAVTGFVKLLSQIVRGLASMKPLVPIVGVALVVAAGAAIFALSSLGWQILKFAMQSEAAEKLMRYGGASPTTGGVGRLLLGGARKFFGAGRLLGGLGEAGAGWAGTAVGAVGMGALAVGVGASVGWTLGRIIEHVFPDNLMTKFFRTYFENHYEEKALRSGQMKIAGRLPGRSLMGDLAAAGREIAEGLLAGQKPGEVMGLQWSKNLAAGYTKRYPGLDEKALQMRALEDAETVLRAQILPFGLTRATVMGEAEQAQARQYSVALEGLIILKKQLEAQVNIKNATKSQEDLSKEARDRAKTSMDQSWRFTDPATPSQKQAYPNN